jgi:hypothetical protein
LGRNLVWICIFLASWAVKELLELNFNCALIAKALIVTRPKTTPKLNGSTKDEVEVGMVKSNAFRRLVPLSKPGGRRRRRRKGGIGPEGAENLNRPSLPGYGHVLNGFGFHSRKKNSGTGMTSVSYG